MKDARFKELLNLHLDHRLSPEEAAELEAALRADPARRKALRDYEAMQSACSALFERVQASAPSSAPLRRSLREAEARIANPRPLRDGWAWPTWGLTGGLAACVALVVARLSQPVANIAQTPSPSPSPATPATPVLAVAAPVAVADSARAAAPRQLTFAALGLDPRSANADSASRWILQNEEGEPYAAVAEVGGAGSVSPDALGAWRSAAVPAAYQSPGHFSARPINAWSGGQSGGYQIETASYRFER